MFLIDISTKRLQCTNCYKLNRGVARGGQEPPRNLADQLTLFKPGGADYTPHTTASPS